MTCRIPLLSLAKSAYAQCNEDAGQLPGELYAVVAVSLVGGVESCAFNEENRAGH